MASHGPRLRAAVDSIADYRAGRPAAPGAFKLSSNENPFPPLPSVVAAIVDAAVSVNRYPDFAASRLVEALALRHGVGTDRIALGTGSVAVLGQAIQICAEPGDEVVFAWRSFEAYPILTRLAGATPVMVPLRPDETHDLPAMLAALTERTRAVVVCTPNNPTGAVVTGAQLVRFVDQVPDDVLVVIDEAYVEFVRRDDCPDALTLLADRPNVVVLRTFSKAYGLAGLRIGYAVASERVATSLRKAAVPFGVTALAERAALASLDAEAELLRRVGLVVGERTRVVRLLREGGCDVLESQGNFVWLRLGERSGAFADACQDAGVVVRAFGNEGVRVTVGEPTANDRFVAVAVAF
ncbi:MAG: histidinol-phosphate transaminase [Actinomycetes bacterium]